MNIKPLLPLFSAFIFIGFAVSCSEQKKKETNDTYKTEMAEELQKQMNLDTIEMIALSDKAKRVTEEWIKYIALNSEIKRLENYTVQDVITNASTIENVVDSLSIGIPREFDKKPVRTRIVTLNTHAKLLKENSERIEPDPSEIKDLSAKLKIDFNNFNIQLNEVFIIEDSPIEID